MSISELHASLFAADEQGRPFLLLYDYTESGVTRRCGFICHARDAREAAELFWGQHTGEWFTLISVNDGSIELFWVRELGRFVTIPGKE